MKLEQKQKKFLFIPHLFMKRCRFFFQFYCALLLLLTVVSNKSSNEMEINRVSIYFSCVNYPEQLLIGI